MLCRAQALQEEFDNERTDMMASHNRQKKEMADLMTAMEAEFAEADSEARQEFEAAREEIRNRSSEEYNVLKISLEGQVEELERTFEAAHQAYLQNTGARATAFQTLTTNDSAAARVIEQRMKKLVQMQVCSSALTFNTALHALLPEPAQCWSCMHAAHTHQLTLRLESLLDLRQTSACAII